MLSFATIVYSRDFPLLELQALSMARFVPLEQVASISVIMNDADEPKLHPQIEALLPAYGALQEKVRVLGGDHLLLSNQHTTSPRLAEQMYVDHRYRIPFVRRQGWRGNNGYRLQQALKLASARCAGSDNIVLLDTKNVFLRPVCVLDFFSEDGRGRLSFLPPKAAFHRNWLAQSLSALEMETSVDDISETTTFATPYPVNRAIMTGLLDEIDQRYGSVQALFASKRRPSEFMLINAYCFKHLGGPEMCFERSDPVNIGLWPDHSASMTDTELDRLKLPEAFSLGLHNRAVGQWSPDQRSKLFDAFAARSICSQKTAERVLLRTSELS